MKPVLFATALAALALSGCAMSPIVMNPRPSLSAPTTGMTVRDDRKITPAPNVKPAPAPAQLLDGMSVLPNDRAVADLVASVVATRFPKAAVALKQFDAKLGVGIWANTSRCEITVEVTNPGAQALTIVALGTNKNWAGGARNMEIAIERALDDLAAKIGHLAP